MTDTNLRLPDPIDTVPVIREVDALLVGVLRSLSEEDWQRMATRAWRVREVAAHLLDGNLRRLSFCRDGMVPGAGPDSGDFTDVLAFLNRVNAEWVTAAQRLSPRLITDLLEITNTQVSDYLATLPLDDPAPFPVAWAGQDESLAWLDVAREYTEKWHHQQQIRAVTGASGLTGERFVVPLLRTLVFGLPRAYRDANVSDTASVRIAVTDLPQLAWVIRRDGAFWRLFDAPADASADAVIELAAESMWKLLFGAPADEIRARTTTSGPVELTAPFFNAVSVMV